MFAFHFSQTNCPCSVLSHPSVHQKEEKELGVLQLYSNFKGYWDRYKCNPAHQDYASQLLKCAIEYNSSRV